jgi:hypothetical protein
VAICHRISSTTLRSKLLCNLAAMISACQKINAKVLLVGMKLPPNFGKTFGERFDEMF